MLKFTGCGLPNVVLADGYTTVAFEGGCAHSYADIAGLYEAIGHAVATSRHPLTGDEFRFLRKRLGWSQAETGACLDKSNQAVAKWEKGETPVPRSDGHVIRLAWLRHHSKKDVLAAVEAMFGDHPAQAEREYVFIFAGRWVRVSRELAVAALQLSETTVQATSEATNDSSNGLPAIEQRDIEELDRVE